MERFVEILPDNKQKTVLTNLVTNKMIAVMCFACFAILLIMGIRAGYQSASAFRFIYTANKVLMFVMLAAAVFGIVKYFVDRAKGRDTSMQVFSGLFITGLALMLAFIFYEMAYTDYISATKLLYLLIPAIAALYLIRLIYRPEFFPAALAGFVIALYIWRFARYNQGTTAFMICQIVLLALLALCIVFFILMDIYGGALTVGGNRYRFFPPDGRFRPVIIALVLFLAITIALFFVPSVYMMYCAYAAAAVVFGFVVYFTVLML